ncbi:unnamed protein product [Fusarium fujikuroi]|uniref:Uncharacterized protein n=1 Tax=Fusarium fujikuroi TaxID=5127 RepID=A0A9Q9S1X0_FUSFU|nr:uncharacterized protein FFE2_15847 [Fusarium fujikuroi]VTT73116.1 unnamed protein product [Fusarium fujikuroi]VTT79711.1 unnamed protein product [Fusarium fujikuroi]VZH99384.1 unnamed protein product [Fusarium fujikuroi]
MEIKDAEAIKIQPGAQLDMACAALHLTPTSTKNLHHDDPPPTLFPPIIHLLAESLMNHD